MSQFHYQVKDNSMSGDRIFNGDTVVISDTESIMPNDICALMCESDISQLEFRRVEEQSEGYLLIPSNHEVATEFREMIHVVGKIITIHKIT